MVQTVVVAGTFDHLHKGHEAVLTRAFAEGEQVIIGLTSDEYILRFKIQDVRFKVQGKQKIRNPNSVIRNSENKIQAFAVRKKQLEQWLSSRGFLSRATIVSIDDPYGPALSTKFDALIITADNKNRGAEINALRKERGLPQVSLVEVPLVPAEDRKPVSSSRVRAGEIDTEGHLVLPDSLRPELAQPLGLVLATPDMIARSIQSNNDKIIITVGDLTTKTLLDAGITPTLSVIDGRLMRQSYEDAIDELKTLKVKTTRVQSGPGFISREAIGLLQQYLQGDALQKEKSVLMVGGEEDLLTLPAVVYYGQPPIAEWACGPFLEGMVEVVVTREKQKEAQTLLERFITKKR